MMRKNATERKLLGAEGRITQGNWISAGRRDKTTKKRKGEKKRKIGQPKAAQIPIRSIL